MDSSSRSSLRYRRTRADAAVTTKFAGRPRHNLPRLGKRQQTNPTPEEESTDSSGDGASSDSSDSGEESEGDEPTSPAAPPSESPSSALGVSPPQQPGVGGQPVGEVPDQNGPATTLTPAVPTPSRAPPADVAGDGILTTLTAIAPPRPTTTEPSQSSVDPSPPVGNVPAESVPSAEPSAVNNPPAIPPIATSQADTSPEPSNNPADPVATGTGLTSIVQDGTVTTPTGNAQVEESAAAESSPAAEPAENDRGTAIGIIIGTLALFALLVALSLFLFKKFRKNKPDVESDGGSTRPKSLGPRTSRMMDRMNDMGASNPIMTQAQPTNNISAVSYGYPSDDPAMLAAYSSTRNDLETMDYYVEKQMASQAPRQPENVYYNGNGANQTFVNENGRYSWQHPGSKGTLPIVYQNADGRYAA